MKTIKNFLVLLILLSGIALQGCAQTNKNSEVIEIKSTVVCGMCKDRVEQNLPYTKGIKDVVVDLKTKIVKVTYNTKKTDPTAIRIALSKLGYAADDIPADKKAFDALPPCCKDPNASDHSGK